MALPGNIQKLVELAFAASHGVASMGKINNFSFLWGGYGLSGPFALPFLLRFLAILLFVFCPSLGARAEPAVGVVSKVTSPAQIGTGTAVVGTPVHMNDRLRTGANARLQVTFNDNSSLTLGENANVVIDRYVFNPDKSSAEVVLRATQGALRFAGGRIEQMRQKNIVVNTPVAALAVRGTHFWAGPIDGKYGVLLLKGKLAVRNRAGAVTLAKPGMGTDIPLRRRGRQAQR
jgi:ferric-dicitrate binding protein FerR (iron transport regulator)